MIFVTRGSMTPHYTVTPAGDGWLVRAGGNEAIAYTYDQGLANAITQALNFEEVMRHARPLMLSAPRGNPELN